MKTGRPRRGEVAFLKSIGIDKKTSMQAQALASMPPNMREDVCKGPLVTQ